jgi:hypothetical protein
MITIFIVVLLCAYFFISGMCFEFYDKNEPTLSTIKSLLLSLAWPGNAVLFLLLRCVK